MRLGKLKYRIMMVLFCTITAKNRQLEAEKDVDLHRGHGGDDEEGRRSDHSRTDQVKHQKVRRHFLRNRREEPAR